jgi:hypothetical protein
MVTPMKNIGIICGLFLMLAAGLDSATRQIHIEWGGGQPRGQVGVTDGKLAGLKVTRGEGSAAGARFAAARPGNLRITLEVEGNEKRYGAAATIVAVQTPANPFSFFLRDVHAEHPIYIPGYGVTVTGGDDSRSHEEIVRALRDRGLQTKLQKIETQPEESFERAAAATRNVPCQTWLGLGRDIRIFSISERLDSIQPQLHGRAIPLPETGNRPCRYQFQIGRGWSAVDQIARRLEDGVLPILRGTLVDDEITYDVTAFVSLESQPLTAKTVRGTHYLVADGHGGGHMFTKEQQAQFDTLVGPELSQPEETVLYLRVAAVNGSKVPRYAFFKNALPSAGPKSGWSFEGASGFGTYSSGRVFSVSRLNGRALEAQELAVLLAPGEALNFEMYVPNRPIPRERAVKLASTDFVRRHAECRDYWRQKLDAAARIDVPESRIAEMIRAGLLHLDLITYGREPDSTLTPSIGTYTAIGSESSPIVQFMDSMGRHDIARRALTFFLDKQHEDGLIQNFGGYMLETGAALWSMGEHYRYTRDDDWVRGIAPKLIKSCEFLHRWHARNQREELRGKGYGMLEGKTADPEDLFRSFMLNGYAYLGLARVAEMLKNVAPAQSRRWDQEAQELKRDIRTAFFESMGRSPVVPLADGTWCPTAPPWAEYRGPLALYADGGDWWTHGATFTRDSLLGPIYLIFQEVIDPAEPAAGFLLNSHNDLMTRRNAAFSQPYYSRHPVAHLRRGEVKPFLKAYYNTVASLPDRQTYTFWEHFFGASPHKTHEEGWFLMDTRWMLYMERGDTLELLAGIPRAWLEDGKSIELKNIATYFGPASLRAVSRTGQDRIEAVVECRTDRKPRAVEVRLPHPAGRTAVRVKGGVYDPQRERVRIEPFQGRAEILLEF